MLSFSKPDSLDLDRFKQHLAAIGMNERCRCVYVAVAAHFLNYEVEKPMCERLPSWIERVVENCSSPRGARDIICDLARFLDFCGCKELREILTAARSCNALVRSLKTGAGWEKAIGEAARPTFQSVLGWRFQAYLDHRASRLMTMSDWPFALRRLDKICDRLEVSTIEGITPAIVVEFLSQNQPGPSTRNARLSKLRVLQRFLEPRGARLHIPAGLELPESKFYPHIFNLAEIAKLLKASRARRRGGTKCHRRAVESVIFLAYACGMRLSEPLKLCLKDVDLIEGTLFIRSTKFYKQRWVPLGQRAIRRLRTYLRVRQEQFPERNAPDDPLFLSRQGRLLRKGNVEHVFRQLVQEVGIRSRGSGRPRLHDLRHSFAVHRLYKWYSEGHDVQNKLPLLSAYLGHDRLHHTEKYLHLTDDLIRQAGQNFRHSFEQLVGPHA